MADLLGGSHVKHGDTSTLRWNLGRDLTGVTDAHVIIRSDRLPGPAVERDGVIETPLSAGIVSLALEVGDYAAGKLDPSPYPYYVEIETTPGPLTHPEKGYERLWVEKDLA